MKEVPWLMAPALVFVFAVSALTLMSLFDEPGAKMSLRENLILAMICTGLYTLVLVLGEVLLT